jgi:hypothetical protein
MVEQQRNLCKIYGKPESSKFKGKTKSLAVDHCHLKEKHGIKTVRGLLCHQCNSGLGNFHDNVELMRKAIQYLEEHA